MKNKIGPKIFDLGGNMTGGADPEAVHFTPQSLTEVQKIQARANIGVPEGWIHIADLDITEAVSYFTQDLGKIYQECVITGHSFVMEAMTEGSTGNGLAVSFNRSNDNRVTIQAGPSTYTRGFFCHIYANEKNITAISNTNLQAAAVSNLQITLKTIPSFATEQTKHMNKVSLEATGTGMGFKGNLQIYAR